MIHSINQLIIQSFKNNVHEKDFQIGFWTKSPLLGNQERPDYHSYLQQSIDNLQSHSPTISKKESSATSAHTTDISIGPKWTGKPERTPPFSFTAYLQIIPTLTFYTKDLDLFQTLLLTGQDLPDPRLSEC